MMGSVGNSRMTQGEASRETGLPLRLVGTSACYLWNARFKGFDADLALSAQALHTPLNNAVATTPGQRFAVMVQAIKNAVLQGELVAVQPLSDADMGLIEMSKTRLLWVQGVRKCTGAFSMSDDVVVSVPEVDCSDPVALGRAVARMCFALSDRQFAKILSRRLGEIQLDLCSDGASASDAGIICAALQSAAEAEWAKIGLGKKHHGGVA